MGMLYRLRARVRNLLHRSRVDRDLSDELESYVDLLADEKRASGMDRAAARRAARLDLGGIAPVTESVRASRAGAGLERFWQDVRYALRGLRRSPGFATMAILTLALGLGANTAIFSVVDAALFKPLPYDHPEQLVDLAYVSRRGTIEAGYQIGLNWTQLALWRNEQQIFSSIEPFGNAQPMKTDDFASVGPTRVGRLSPGVLNLLGVRPVIGRGFVADDVQQTRTVALISENFWRRSLAGDRAVIGRDLTLDGHPHTIVGVMPERFSYRVGGRDTVAWLPFDEAGERRAGRPGAPTILRLRPGLTLEAARNELNAAAGRIQQATPASARWDVDLLPFDTRAYGDNDTRMPLLVLLGAVDCVLLIACANVANLQLSRIFARQRELAVRVALGATRGRLIRQFLTEGLVLASIGGAAALALAWWTVKIVPASLPPRLWLFAYNPMALDGRTLGFCAGVVLMTSILCSLVPALRAARTDLTGAFEGSSRTAGVTRGARRVRNALQIVQVALTVVLLAATGLLASSFARMRTTEPGFDIDRLASMSVALPASRYPTPAVQGEFFETLLARVRALPGVHAATYGTPPPSGGAGNFMPFGHEADSTLPSSALSLLWVDADYFAVAGIPVKEGRLFGADDSATSPRVALIDEEAARRYFPGRSALGQQFRFNQYVPWATVVGVVGHIKTTSFTFAHGTSQAYFPNVQSNSPSRRTLLVRADVDPLAVAGAVSSVVRELDPSLTPSPPLLTAGLYDDVLATPRFYLILMSLLAGLALLTACVGLYGIVSYSVTQRRREIGVRIALGADPGRIQGLVMKEATRPVVAGVAAGLIGAWWLTRYLSALLYRVTPLDPATLGVVVAVMMAVALSAALVPARRATKMDPVLALRVE